MSTLDASAPCQQINLFNPVFQPQKKLLGAPMMAAAALLLAGGIGVLAASGNTRIARMQADVDASAALLARKQARLASVKEQFAPRQRSAEIQADILATETRMVSLRLVAGVLERGELGEQNGFSDYFKAFARQSMPEVWLTGVSIAGKDIGLKGRTTDPALVPGYIARLTQEPLLQGKSFASLRIAQAEPVQTVGSDGKPGTGPAPYVEFSLQSLPEGASP